jgi:hypothetical protein
MKYPPVSACVFIRNTFDGAFMLFESMASLLPFVSDFLVMDLGSTDGTAHYLERIAEANPRVRLVHGEFSYQDAGVFATLANDLIAMCEQPNVWYYQSDEIPHQGLLKLVRERFARGEFDLRMWRVQLGYNFQEPRWLPHFVHRVGHRDDGSFVFVGDGMNTKRYLEPPVCSQYGGEYFTKWGEMWDAQGVPGLEPYMHEMLLDVSLLGGFRDNVPARRRMHAPFWHETPIIPYRPPGSKQDRQLAEDEWVRIANADDRWTRAETPFDIPHIMRWHVGRTKYALRQELFDALCQDNTLGLLGLGE